MFCVAQDKELWVLLLAGVALWIVDDSISTHKFDPPRAALDKLKSTLWLTTPSRIIIQRMQEKLR